MMRAHSVFSLLLLLTASTAHAQQPSPPSAPQSLGAITGRVLSNEDHPLPDARVTVFPVPSTSQASRSHSAQTDEEGYFRAADLPPGNYSVQASAEGYLSASAYRNERATGDERYYHPGDSVTIRLKKGGVITGKVTNAKGEPVIGAAVSAMLARQSDGSLVRMFSLQRERPTDDRGVYRLFGLFPGTYVIAVQGRGRMIYLFSGYDGSAPTYYPSSTRETATEVTVRESEEVSGIDISFRHEQGHTVSGLVADAIGSAPNYQSSITLSYPGSGIAVANAPSSGDGNTRAFALYGVPDGEYEVRAERRASGNDEGAVSLPLRVTVKGADVTGLSLKLTPFGAIAGRLAIEAASADSPAARCQINRQTYLPNTEITALLDRPEQAHVTEKAHGRATAQGEFRLRQLETGRYRLVIRPPSEGLYIRAITRPGLPAARQPSDVARQGLAIQPGERVEELTITLAEGAASVRGRVVASIEGARLPARLRVHLVPAERESADDLLRYAQTNARSDGTFSFTNLAPGRYWLLVRPIPDDESTETAVRPAAWDSDDRAKLRREAQAANVVIELQPCQRVSDYTLRYAPSLSNR